MSDRRWDVIVVGAGFAGATAARECATRGLRTLVLEARDRIGGRTHTAQLSNGDVVELGGTYVHWLQPHTWSEISRYGLEDDVVPGDEMYEAVLSPQGDGLGWSTAEEHERREQGLFERMFAPSYETLPKPFDPLATDAAKELDGKTIRQRLDELQLAPDDDAMLSALFGCETCEADGGGSFLGLLRWWAPAGHTYGASQEAVYGYKMRNGISQLLATMLADGGAELRLEAPVARVEDHGDAVTVTCEDGSAETAGAVVVATAPAVWPHVAFSPALAPARQAAATDLQVRRGAKAVVVLRGEPRRIFVQPLPGHPVGAMWTTRKRSEDEQAAVVFIGPGMDDPRDEAAVAAAVRDLLPHVEVTEVLTGVYDEHDPYVRAGWPLTKPGALARHRPYETLSQPQGRVAFAAADLARLWSSFIDGAIESGMRAARQVRSFDDTMNPRGP